MKKIAYGKPFLIGINNNGVALNKIENIDELSIQNFVFNTPECLPISDINESFNPALPVCKELNTPVGPLDILMATPNGDLIIIETKLWRNPEARRIVVAQILDYAKELSTWTYEDLQREINRKLGRKGNTLYHIVKESQLNIELPESDFVDAVSRNLSRGRFLLLIVGDGIREGVKGITEFLSNSAHLNFSCGMIELNIYSAAEIGTLIIPRTLAKTIEIPKISVEIPSGLSIINNGETSMLATSSKSSSSPEKEWESNFYINFWQELVNEISFDDPGQPLPKPAKGQNLFIYLDSNKKAWISAYFMKSDKRIGVYFRTQKDNDGEEIINYLDEYKDDIRSELGRDVLWTWDQTGDVGVRKHIDDIHSIDNREEIKDFFKFWLNRFVNVFRPRIKSIPQ